MSIKDLKPKGLTDMGIQYARMTQEPHVYAQGGAPGMVVIWLAIGDLETMIGEGEPEAAIDEAMQLLESLRANVQPQVVALLQAQRRAS